MLWEKVLNYEFRKLLQIFYYKKLKVKLNAKSNLLLVKCTVCMLKIFVLKMCILKCYHKKAIDIKLYKT